MDVAHHLRSLLIFFCIASSARMTAQPAYQRALVGGNNAPNLATVVRTIDGSVFRRQSAGEECFQKVNALGDTLWCMLWPLSLVDFDKMPDGGIAVLMDRGVLDFTNGNPDSDSSYHKVLISRVSGSGLVLWSKCYRLRSPAPLWGPGHDLYSLRTDPDGRIFVNGTMGSTLELGPPYAFTFCVDVNGSLLWASQFGSADPATDQLRAHHLAPDGTGGCDFLYDDAGGLPHLLIGRLRNDGALAWITKAIYQNTSGMWTPGEMTATPESVTSAGELDISGVGRRWYTLAIDSTSHCKLLSAFGTDPEITGGYYLDAPSVATLPGGDMLIDGHSTTLRFLRATAQGEVVAAARTTSFGNSQHVVSIITGSSDVLGSSLSTVASIDDEELVFGYHTYTKGYWSLSADALTGCGLEPVAVTSDTTSNASIISAVQVIGPYSSPLEYDVVDTSIILVRLPSFSPMDFCGSLGIDDYGAVDSDRLIMASPVRSGSDIMIESSTAANVELIDLLGRHLFSQRVSAYDRVAISGSGHLAVGTYVVLATDVHGRRIAGSRVIVE